jgi:hypothetical protein
VEAYSVVNVVDPTFSRQYSHRWQQDCQPYAPAALYSQNHYFSAPDTYICWRLSKPRGLVRLEELGKLEKLIHLNGSRTRDLRACSIVPQLLRWTMCQNLTLRSTLEFPILLR